MIAIGSRVAWTTNDGRARAGRVVGLAVSYGVEIAYLEDCSGACGGTESNEWAVVQVARLEVAS